MKKSELTWLTKEPGQTFSLEYFLQNYKGGISIDEGLALSRYAADILGGRIVEVGSYRGKSAIALAWGLKNNPSLGKKIFCIEPHQHFKGIYGGEFGPADRGCFYDIMLKTGFFSDVSLINLSSDVLAPGWKEKTDFVFIDGDHRYEGVKRDAQCWMHTLRVGGIIAFDDATDPKIGPLRVVENLIAGGNYEKIETVGKIVFLKKVKDDLPEGARYPYKRLSLLVACDSIILSGGLLRFERLGETLAKQGHQLSFVVLSDHPAYQFKSQHPVLGVDDLATSNWDAVMIPGAGFPEETISRFSGFSRPNFGIRIQHILNDQSRRDSFLKVNKAFKPDIVIFNNPHWEPGDFIEFQAKRFHYLFGAVDTRYLFPRPYKEHFLSQNKWCIGGLATKNPEPLIEAIKLLPENYTLNLFGNNSSLVEKYPDLIMSKRLVLSGTLDYKQLLSYYHSVDCIVHLEEFAGWANLVAEGMACGLPVICTGHGTQAFVKDGENAIVLKSITPESIVGEIEKLSKNTKRCEVLAANGRKTIMNYTWEHYSRSLLSFIYDDGIFHYSYCPELGLNGKWPLQERLRELTYLMKKAENATILDLGAAEGLVAKEFSKYGSKIIHGFELDTNRVRFANEIVGDNNNIIFRTADLSSWERFVENNKDILLRDYDIVLYLGLQHHLPESSRKKTLAGAMGMAKKMIAVRTTDEVYEKDRIESEMISAGFIEVPLQQSPKKPGLGQLHIFKKRDKQQAIKSRHFISYPKSGRSWLRYLLTGLGVVEHIHFHHDQFEFNDGKLPLHNFEIKDRMEKYSKEDRIVYLTRDPRDIIVSLYFQITGRFKDFFNYEGTISEFIKDAYFGAKNLQQFREMWAQLSDQLDVLVITYEDCHHDIGSVCRSILNFYELSTDNESIEKAIQAASFDNMKKVEQSSTYKEPWLRPRNDALKVRKGKVGGFRDELTKEDVDYLNDIFKIDR